MNEVITLIGYPNGHGNKRCRSSGGTKGISAANRGMSLEKDLNDSNQYYLQSGRALIHKKPTPIQVVKVDYPSRNAAKITEAYYKVPSTTDYNGIYRGRPIDFEAKETVNKTSFPFKSIHPHQIEHLRLVKVHGGIGFFIIRFRAYGETYLIDAKEIIERYQHSACKSISYKEIQQIGSLIREGLTPRLCYLDNVDALYFQEVTQHDEERQNRKKCL